MIGDIEEIKKKLIHGLSNNECEIDEITIDSSYGNITNTSCRVTLKERPDYWFTAGWTRPPKKVSYEEYCYNDWMRTMKAYNAIDKDRIKNVIFNNPATIVFWGDGTKTVVKCEDTHFDPEKGLAMAIAKHFMGTNKSKSNYYDVFDEYVSKEWDKSNEQRTISSEIIGKIVKQEKTDDGLSLGFTLHCKPVGVDGAISKPVKPTSVSEIIVEELAKNTKRTDLNN